MSKLKAVAKEIGSYYLSLDINNIQQMERSVSRLFESEKISILVNSAGVHGNEPFGAVTEENFDNVISTNVKALYFLSQAVANQMINKGIRG